MKELNMSKEKNPQRTAEAERKREAQRIINRVERESEQVGTSAMARSANKVRDHFLGVEQPKDDKIEIMGKRIARVLAIIVFIVLAFSIVTTYILPQ
ncbi:MAG: hypothetical protein L3J32_06670 [Rhizobiaceae bacterium]|nr:hypothetical protein [Rhizobiaceae bacterium]